MCYLALFLVVNGAKTAYSLLCSSVCLRLINLFTLCCVFGFFLAPIWGASRVDCCQGRVPGRALQPLIAAHLSGPREEHGTGNWELGILDSAALICVSHQLATFSAAHRHSTPLSVRANRQTVALCISSCVSLLQPLPSRLISCLSRHRNYPVTKWAFA